MDNDRKYYVYIVKCNDNTLYTGITVDLERRIFEHNNNNQKAAKYIIPRRPVELVYSEICKSRSDASKLEYKIKHLKRSEKEKMINEKKIIKI